MFAKTIIKHLFVRKHTLNTHTLQFKCVAHKAEYIKYVRIGQRRGLWNAFQMSTHCKPNGCTRIRGEGLEIDFLRTYLMNTA